jgi:hypothetical protein
VFCAVLAWSRWRFVRFAADERSDTTLAMLAECFETLGGVPKVVLADRMACLKGAVVANVVVPTPDYVRFAMHYRFRPDFCEGGDPASKGIVENLVGYAKSDLVVPAEPDVERLDEANADARVWGEEANGQMHSEICAIPAERLVAERELLAPLPSLRPRIGRATRRKVDRLACVRIGSARYSVPVRLIGHSVEVFAVDGRVKILDGDEVGLTRFDGHPPRGAKPRKGCPEWRPWRRTSLGLVVRSHRSSRKRSSMPAGGGTALFARWPATSI